MRNFTVLRFERSTDVLAGLRVGLSTILLGKIYVGLEDYLCLSLADAADITLEGDA